MRRKIQDEEDKNKSISENDNEGSSNSELVISQKGGNHDTFFTSNKVSKKPVLTDQEKFESDMLDLKLAIKQTEELIVASKKRKYNPNEEL